MTRVVVTGIGIVSCIGNTTKDVINSLYNSKSGITFSEEYKELGFRSHVYGKPDINLEEKIDRRALRFMGDNAAYNHIAMEDAIKDARLSEDLVSKPETGIIMGSGGPSTKNIVQASEIYKMENDSYPPDCWETLKEEDYLEIKESITRNGSLNAHLMKMVKVGHFLLQAPKKWVVVQEKNLNTIRKLENIVDMDNQIQVENRTD